tara:strand:- start:121 stop:306 length:186 start_codon:yes stop_codon:yes gene_type:complete
MNTKYALIIFSIFFIVTIIFTYLKISGDLDSLLIQLKWFMRITFPLFVIFLFYLGIKNEKK